MAIRRKMEILKKLGGTDLVYAWTRGVYGRLAKGKIHCSCPMCRRKSYDERSHRDKKAQLRAKQQIDEWNLSQKEGNSE